MKKWEIKFSSNGLEYSLKIIQTSTGSFVAHSNTDMQKIVDIIQKHLDKAEEVLE